MTAPGGVPNLPMGALTISNISDVLHDMSPATMRGRVVERMPSTFNSSIGGNPAEDFSFFGIITSLWAGFNSAVANADPADITGPDDLPGLLVDFVGDLPIIGEFIDLIKSIVEGTYEPGDVLAAIVSSFNTLGEMLGVSLPDFSLDALVDAFGDLFAWFGDILDAMSGDYAGADTALLAVQSIFEPIRKLLQLLTGLSEGFPSAGEIDTEVSGLLDDVANAVDNAVAVVRDALTGITDATPTDLDDWLLGLLTGESSLDAANLTNMANIPAIAQSKITGLVSDLSTALSNASAAVDDVADIAKGIFDSWFGGTSGTGTVAEVETAVASIKSAVANGYSVAYFTSSDPTWSVPSGVSQMIGCVINGGGKGDNGTATNGSSAAGGDGGSDGGYLSADLDMTGITPGTSTLAVTVGAAATTAGTDGAQSKIMFGATTLLAGAAGANGIASAQGLIGTTSTPGAGGDGGTALSSGTSGSGTAGEDSGVATGGTGGTGGSAGAGTGDAGSAGGTGVSSSVPLCGGAGGGGGAGKGTGSIVQAVTGGAGGNGGFPGGGSGGGGGACNSGGGIRTGGASGTPGNGLVAILYK